MSRLISTLRWDVQLQFRNGFYYAIAFVLVMWALILSQIPRLELDRLLPALLLGNMVLTTFYFISALVLLEKDQGTLEAQVVTPLRKGEYLAAKILSLAALTVLENVVIVGLVFGVGFQLLPLLAGIIAASVLFVLAGFVAVARYHSINEYLMPSIVYVLVLLLPSLPAFGLGTGWWFFWHPLYGALVLLEAAFQPLAIWQIASAALTTTLWSALFALWAHRAFVRFIIHQP